MCFSGIRKIELDPNLRARARSRAKAAANAALVDADALEPADLAALPRAAGSTGLRNLPCHGFWANAAWLEIALAATDLVTWAQLIGFRTDPSLARAEIATFRYRVLHVAARITRGARRLRLRIDATWRWATSIATAWQTIRTAFE